MRIYLVVLVGPVEMWKTLFKSLNSNRLSAVLPVEKAVEIAERIAKQAPLGVRATIKSSRMVQTYGFEKAKEYLTPQIMELFASEDAKEGVRSFLERREGNFKGK